MTTAPVPTIAPVVPPHRPAPSHEHAWETLSRHTTSEGVLRYVRCVSCGAHRVDVHALGGAVPTPVSRAVEGR